MSYSSIDGFNAYQIYTAVKLHFDSKTYDYFKYNGKTGASTKSFIARKDKYFFAKLARTYGVAKLPHFYACNFAHHGTKWVGGLTDDQADETYKSFNSLLESFTYRFKNDIDKIISNNDFKSLFVVEDGQHPLLVKMLLQDEIPLETFTVLNRYIGFMPKFDKEITDPIMWPDISLKIRKYNAFITVNNEKIKEALKDCLQSSVDVV
jgi:hypothetical protein